MPRAAKFTKEGCIARIWSARAAMDAAERDFHAWIRRAARAGATIRELEEPTGLKKSRLAQIVKGE